MTRLTVLHTNDLHGRIQQRDRVYRVASTDMVLSDFTSYLNLPDDQIEYELPTIMPEVLQDYVEARTSIGASDQRFFPRD